MWMDFFVQVMYAANDVLAIMAICFKITFNECQPRADFDKLVMLARNEGMQWRDQQFDRFSSRPSVVFNRDRGGLQAMEQVQQPPYQELQDQQDSTENNSFFLVETWP